MTKPGLSLLAVLLDRSSSARPAADAIRSGVDALLADQRERPGELLVTLATDSASGHETVCALRPVADVAPVTLTARGGSSLHEGIVTLIDDVGAELAGLEESERPERVIVAVVGDTAAEIGGTGLETGGSDLDTGGADLETAGSDLQTGDTDVDVRRVRELVERQRSDYAWEFVLVDLASGDRGLAAGQGAGAGTTALQADGADEVDEPHRNGSTTSPTATGSSVDHGGDELRTGGPGEAGAPPTDRSEEQRSDVLTAVALAEARLGVPATAAILAGPGPDGVRAGLAAASAFVSRARETRPWEPVEGFTDDERAAASVPAPARPAWWRRLLGIGG